MGTPMTEKAYKEYKKMCESNGTTPSTYFELTGCKDYKSDELFTCTSCDTPKSTNDFYKDNSARNHISICKDCKKAASAKRQKEKQEEKKNQRKIKQIQSVHTNRKLQEEKLPTKAQEPKKEESKVQKLQDDTPTIPSKKEQEFILTRSQLIEFGKAAYEKGRLSFNHLSDQSTKDLLDEIN